MTETTVGREVVQIVEIKQPFCDNVYGSAPCTASGTAALKCYNTRSTCQDPDNFALGDPLSLFFTRGNPADRGISGVPYARPLLLSVSTQPAQINIAGADPDSEGIGRRAVLNITFQDAPDTDRLVDPYLSGRTGTALDKSTFWAKWATRNRYRQNMQCIIYEGYAGQTLAQMVVQRSQRPVALRQGGCEGEKDISEVHGKTRPNLSCPAGPALGEVQSRPCAECQPCLSAAGEAPAHWSYPASWAASCRAL